VRRVSEGILDSDPPFGCTGARDLTDKIGA
jgi:hypothetical protein